MTNGINLRRPTPASVPPAEGLMARLRPAFRAVRFAAGLADWRLRAEVPYCPGDRFAIERARLILRIGPTLHDLDEAWRILADVLDAPAASDDEIDDLVGLGFDAFASFKADERPGVVLATAEAVALAADEYGWPATVVAAGIAKVLRSSRFVPSPAELIDAMAAAAKAFEAAQRAVDRASSARAEAEMLIAAIDGMPADDPDRVPF